MARVTKMVVGHSLLLGVRPSRKTFAGHFCSDWVSRLLPVWKPLPRQSATAAAWQSGAPLSAGAQRSRPVCARGPGKAMAASFAPLAALSVTLFAASLAAARAWLLSLSI